ncbi:MAG: PPOX class F420-dependent oxidoreductase [Solirubrobacteraceae bacterium]
MPASIEGRSRELLEQPNFCHISTVRPDGAPHAAIVWVDLEDGNAVVNSAEGRARPRNLERDGRVLLTVANRENQYEYTQIRGHLREASREDGDSHADKLTKKYLDKDKYPFGQPGEVRVKFVIEPDEVKHFGG